MCSLNVFMSTDDPKYKDLDDSLYKCVCEASSDAVDWVICAHEQRLVDQAALMFSFGSFAFRASKVV